MPVWEGEGGGIAISVWEGEGGGYSNVSVGEIGGGHIESSLTLTYPNVENV